MGGGDGAIKQKIKMEAVAGSWLTSLWDESKYECLFNDEVSLQKSKHDDEKTVNLAQDSNIAITLL